MSHSRQTSGRYELARLHVGAPKPGGSGYDNA